MERFSVAEMSRQPGRVIKSAQQSGAIITNRGQPTAVIIDYETFVTMRLRDRILGDAQIMAAIEKAVKEPTTPWSEVKTELGLEE